MDPQGASPVMGGHDGAMLWHRAGPDETLSAVEWPLTRLTSASCEALGAVKSLAQLDLSGEYFPVDILAPSDIERLSSSASLQRLSLHGVSISSEAFLALVRGMPRLHALDVRGLDLADADVPTLAGAAPALIELKLGTAASGAKRHTFESTRVGAQSWRALVSFEFLKDLTFTGVDLDDAMVTSHPEILQRLTALDLSDTVVADETARLLAGSSRLRELVLRGTRLTDVGARALAEVPTLEAIDIGQTRASADGLVHLLSARRFSRLSLAGLPLNAQAIQPLESQGDLQDLDLSGVAFGTGSALPIERLPSVRSLRLDYVPLNDAHLDRLRCDKLEHLSLRGIQMTQAGMAALARAKQLRTISLRIGADWTGIEKLSAEVDLIARPPQALQLPHSLRKLTLVGALTPSLRDGLGRLEGFYTLGLESEGHILAGASTSDFSGLKSVMAEDAGLDDAALARLLTLPRLEELFVSGNPLSRALIQFDAPFLNTLELRRTNIGDDAVAAIARLPRLHCLDVPDTCVTMNGIARLVETAPNLQSLALDARQVGDASVNAMRRAQALIELYLYGKAINDATISSLRHLEQLRELNLHGASRLTLACLPGLAAMAHLRTLRLVGTDASADLLEALRQARPDIRVHRVGAANTSAGLHGRHW